MFLQKKATLDRVPRAAYDGGPMSDPELYARFQKQLLTLDALELTLDVSRIHFAEGFFASMEPRVQAALTHMAELEAGAVANPDEKRRVGHYWLRAPELAPEAAMRAAIEGALRSVTAFAADVHAMIRGAREMDRSEEHTSELQSLV